MHWWWGYTETVSPRPPRLHRISTTVPVALLFSYLKRHFIHRLAAGAVSDLVGRRPMSR